MFRECVVNQISSFIFLWETIPNLSVLSEGNQLQQVTIIILHLFFGHLQYLYIFFCWNAVNIFLHFKLLGTRGRLSFKKIKSFFIHLTLKCLNVVSFYILKTCSEPNLILIPCGQMAKKSTFVLHCLFRLSDLPAIKIGLTENFKWPRFKKTRKTITEVFPVNVRSFLSNTRKGR